VEKDLVSQRAARLALVSLIAALSLLLPAGAGATAPAGPNGDLVFTSGRSPNTDAQARIWTVDHFGSGETQVTSVPPSNTGQHRQPNWSPDHTKIVYAIDTGEIRVRDLVAGTDVPFVTAAAAQDRPTWSPDGTKIAFGSGGKIYVKPFPSAAGSAATTATAVTNGTSDERPVWSPDGNTIYYNHTVAGNFDIVKRSPVTLGGTETPLVTGAATNDWQPAVSPDGSQLCFLRGPKTNDADIWTASTSAANTNLALFASDAPTPNTLGSLNCVWSPDGTEIAFTRGAFGQGDLVKKDVGSSPTAAPTTITGVAGVFDGNADWAVNFRPVCQNSNRNVPVNGFLTVPLSCTDRDKPNAADIDREIASPPSHGIVGEVDDDADSVVYTPNANFSGTDSFTFTGSDGNSTSSAATVSITVGNTGGGGGGGGGKDTTASNITGVDVSPGTWRRGSALPSFNAAAKVGTTIKFNLSEKAAVTLTFQRQRAGRRVGRRCVAPKRSNRKRRKCKRYTTAGRLFFNGKAGANRVKFAGRLSRRKRLALGRYRLRVSAKDAAGNVSKTRTDTFRIVRR
jgi:Tol biopolymer transport system component